MTRLAVLALMLAVAAAAASSAFAKTTPFGHTYQTTVKGQAAPLDGVWLIAFTPRGAYTVTRKPSSAALIGGSATLSGKTLTLHDAGGPLACKGSAKTGSYAWTLAGKTLTLKILKDPCGGRPLIMEPSPPSGTALANEADGVWRICSGCDCFLQAVMKPLRPHCFE